MKTYKQYMDAIHKREEKVMKPWREQNEKYHRKHLTDPKTRGIPCYCFYMPPIVPRTAQEVSVEIMGMMLKDFLKEWKAIYTQKV